MPASGSYPLLFSIGMMVLGGDAVLGQPFPARPIRIMTSAPGETSDFTSRLIGRGLTESRGQQVIVDNRGRRSCLHWPGPGRESSIWGKVIKDAGIKVE